MGENELALLLQMGNELNSDAKVAAQMVLGLVVLIITLLLVLPRFWLVESIPKCISDVVGTLDHIVVQLLQLICNLHQIIPVAHEGFQRVESILKRISNVVKTLDHIVVRLLRLIRNLHQIIPAAHEGFQQVVLVLEFIHHVVGPLVDFVDLLLLLISICRRIWIAPRARQPVVVANYQ